MKKSFNTVLSNKFVKGGIIFTGIELINKLFPFLLLPIIAKKLSPDDFGIITNYTVLVSILMILVNFGGIPNIVVKYKVGFSESKFKRYLNASLLVSLFNFLIILIISLPLIQFDLFQKSMGLTGGLVLFAIIETLFDCLLMIYVSLSRFTKSYKELAFIRFGQTIMGFVLSLVLIYGFDMNYEGRIAGIFASSVVFGMFVFLRQGYNVKISTFNILKKYSFRLYKICWPLIPHQISKLLRNGSDKIILTTFIGLAANGLYSVTLQFATIFYVITESFSMSYLPSIFEKLKNKEVPADLIKRFNKFCLLLTVPIYFISYFLISCFFDHRYQDVKFYLIPILLAFLMRSLNLMQGNQFIYFQKTKSYSAITVSVSILHFGLSIVAIKFIGLMGLLFLLFLSESAIYVVTNIQLKKLHHDQALR